MCEVRGPIGGYFVWEPERGGPLLLVAGGSGLVPLMCIERLRRRAAPAVASTLLLSARAPDDVIYADELDGAVLTYTRRAPPAWPGLRAPRRRRDAGRGGAAPGRAPALLRLRADGLRRAGRGRPGAARPPSRADQDRALRKLVGAQAGAGRSPSAGGIIARMPIRSPYPDIEVPDVSLTEYVLGRCGGARRQARADRRPDAARSRPTPSSRSAWTAVAAGLAAEGIGPGDTVGLLAPNSVDWPVAYHAAISLGAIVTPINPLLRPYEVADAAAARPGRTR